MNEIALSTQVAVLRLLSDEVKTVNTQLRAAAEEHFRDLRRSGTKSLHPQLPDGTEIGRITITTPAPVVQWSEAALTEFVQATAPTEVVEHVDPAVLTDPEFIKWVLTMRPDMVTSSVRPAYRERLKRELNEAGELVDRATGEVYTVAQVERPAPGKFSYKPSDDARELVLRAWERGQLAGMGGVFTTRGPTLAEKDDQ